MHVILVAKLKGIHTIYYLNINIFSFHIYIYIYLLISDCINTSRRLDSVYVVVIFTCIVLFQGQNTNIALYNLFCACISAPWIYKVFDTGNYNDSSITQTYNQRIVFENTLWIPSYFLYQMCLIWSHNHCSLGCVYKLAYHICFDFISISKLSL